MRQMQRAPRSMGATLLGFAILAAGPTAALAQSEDPMPYEDYRAALEEIARRQANDDAGGVPSVDETVARVEGLIELARADAARLSLTPLTPLT